MKKIAFIVHGKIKNRDTLIADLKSAFDSEFEIAFYITAYAQHSIALAEEAAIKGSTYIICIGGDGSLNEVINGVMQAKDKITPESWQHIRVGLYPKGTGNDFARTVQVKPDIQKLKQCILNDTYSLIDLGLASYTDLTGRSSSRYFINITDIGMGGIIAQKLASYSTWMGAGLTFQRAIISTLIGYKKQAVELKADQIQFTGEIMNVAFANGKYFGNGLGIAPDALPGDGIFSIVIIGKISMIDYIRLLGEVKRCRIIDHSEFKYFAARNIEIKSEAEDLPIDMDGDFVGYSPLKIEVVAAAIKFLTGADK
jgi:diacylglycerol kinase (ATP)